MCVCVGVVYKWAMHKFLNSIHITRTSRAMDLHYGCYGEEYFISPELEQVIENNASHTNNPHQKTSQYPTFMNQHVCVCVCVCVCMCVCVCVCMCVCLCVYTY